MYFSREVVEIDKKTRERRASIAERQHRALMPGYKKARLIVVGDIIEISFRRNNALLGFEGICLSIKRKGFYTANSTLLLRNVILGVGIEVSVTYYENRLMKLYINDFKRKTLVTIRRNKLYYIRNRLNRESRVK